MTVGISQRDPSSFNTITAPATGRFITHNQKTNYENILCLRPCLHGQAGRGVSLEAQREAIQAFADREEMVISEWFEEKQTAAKGGRPVFDRMIKALKAGKADGLIIHKIDRSARNFADWAKIGDLSDAGVDIHFATESLDFRTRGGRLTADIQAVIAADYVRNLREECIKGMNGRLKQGLYPWGAPLGYVDNGGGKPKTPDPERAYYVKEAFELYETGQYSLRALLSEMQRRGFRGGMESRSAKAVSSSYCPIPSTLV